MKNLKLNIKSILFVAFCIILMLACFVRIEVVFDLLGFVFSVFAPVIVGFCIAFIFDIPASFFEKKVFFFLLSPNKKNKTYPKLARLFSIILTLVLIIGAISLLMFFIIPQIIETISAIISAIPGFTVRAVKFSQKHLDEFGITSEMISKLILDSKNILTTIADFLKENMGSFVNIGSSLLSGIVNTLLGLFVAIYFLFDKEKILYQFKRFFRASLKPDLYKNSAHVIHVSSRSFSNFISGQLIEACILGVLCFIGMLIFRMPYASVVSVIIGVCALIPILGAWIGTAISFCLILINDPVKALWFVVFILVLQQIEGNLIYPRVVGKQVGLPGVWVLLSIVIGSGFMGVMGALIAVPVTSVLYTLASEYVVKKEKEANLQ